MNENANVKGQGVLSGYSYLVVEPDLKKAEKIKQVIESLDGQAELAKDLDKAYGLIEAAHSEFDEYTAVIISEALGRINIIDVSHKIKIQLEMECTMLILMADNMDRLKNISNYSEADGFLFGELSKEKLSELLLPDFIEEDFYEREAVADRPDMSGKRALLVDDNEMNREVASGLLQLTGIQILEAVDGFDALEKLDRYPGDFFDIVFLDICMPVMDGHETARKMRQRGFGMPIIAMTANAFYEDVQASKDAGMNAHLAKPLIMDEIFEVLKKYLLN